MCQSRGYKYRRESGEESRNIIFEGILLTNKPVNEENDNMTDDHKTTLIRKWKPHVEEKGDESQREQKIMEKNEMRQPNIETEPTHRRERERK